VKMDLEWKALFERDLLTRKDKIRSYLASREYRRHFSPKHIYESVYSYINANGKSLRPAVLLLSCGAVGGDEEKAMPAAAAIEVYHAWTLVHDDLIDKDERRRGCLTVHEEFRRKAIEELGYNEGDAQHYGISIAVLAGDVQQGWSVSLLCELYYTHNIDPTIVLYLINDLKMDVQSTLVDGETLDIQYSKLPIESLNENMIVEMLWKKTGVLYEFAGRAGAMIGLGTCDPNHEFARAISTFASKCGIAFQLQDDILGISGDESLLGKPVGSDIREGKRTTIVYHAFKNANDKQKEILLSILGNEQATEGEINEATNLLRQLGGIEHTKNLARLYVKDALLYLDDIPESKYKDLLSIWAEYMIEREF
jgi:geranylgeranyl diphosphate synthase type I